MNNDSVSSTHDRAYNALKLAKNTGRNQVKFSNRKFYADS